jgi:hypothetical protein
VHLVVILCESPLAIIALKEDTISPSLKCSFLQER